VKTHYDVIGIEQAAEVDEVKRAFRREIARYHPDKVQHLGTEFQEIAATRAAALTEAYRVLMDTQLRERYDAALQQPLGPPAVVRSSRDHGEAVSFVRRAVSARLTEAVVAGGGTMVTAAGFDWVFQFKGARSLFRKAEPSVRVAVRIVSTVDAAAINEAWPIAVRLSAEGETLCLMMLGSGMAPARDLSVAVTELRKKTRRAAPVVVPVDVRDWDALLPAETPAAVRVLLDRLRRRD
jgi:hypothetical protein